MTEVVYQDESAIRTVVERFESCDYALDEFTHARHLTVACWCLCTMPPEVALTRMRAGLMQFIAHHGKHGYHETITRFWMELLGDFLGGLPSGTSLVQKTNRAVQRFGSKDLLFAYYTRERVMSDTARREWVQPDLRSIAEAHALPSGALEKQRL